MFDPKSIYRKLDIRKIIGNAPIRYELQEKDWPADEMAFIRLYTPEGRNGWVLIAPGSTVEGVTASLLAVSGQLIRKAASCGTGDVCGI